MTTPTVEELFSRDPLQLSSTDLDTIIAKMRESRLKFVQGSLTAGKPESRKTATEKKTEALAKNVDAVDLSDLGL
jgi:hypothetical protein